MTVKIDYRFLNMDTCEFVDTQETLSAQLRTGSLLRAIPSQKHAQVVIAGGSRHFTEADVVHLCRKLSGDRLNKLFGEKTND